LPWPGDNACTAPQPNAVTSSSRSTPSPAAASLNTFVSPSSARRSPASLYCVPSGLSTVPAPGLTRSVALRTSAGLDSRSAG
jgi:hypothetical protein